MSREKRKLVDRRERTKSEPHGEDVHKPIAPPPPDGLSSESVRGRTDRFVALKPGLWGWWKTIVAIAAGITAIGAATGPIKNCYQNWCTNRQQRQHCTEMAESIKEAVRCADWHSVSAQVTGWQVDSSNCPREFDLEVNLYRAMSEVWAGRISVAQDILAKDRHYPNASPDLQHRKDYVATVVDRAAGRILRARDKLLALLAPKRIESLPADVRFDALYDLIILELHRGDSSEVKRRLLQIEEAVGTDEMRRSRKLLLEGLISYLHGRSRQCINTLQGLKDRFREAPTREGLRLSSLASCREQLEESQAVHSDPPESPKEFFRGACSQWDYLDMRANDIRRTLDKIDREIIGSLYADDGTSVIVDISEHMREANAQLADFRELVVDDVKTTEETPYPWIRFNLELLEARLALMRLRPHKPGDEEPLRRVRGNIETLLEQGQQQQLVLLQVWCHLALAEAAAIEKNTPEVITQCGKAERLARNADFLVEATRAILKRAQYRMETGDADACRKDISDAIKIFEMIGNDTWVERLGGYLKDEDCCLLVPPQDGVRRARSSSGDTRP